jgi:hypothetical protein
MQAYEDGELLGCDFIIYKVVEKSNMPTFNILKNMRCP